MGVGSLCRTGGARHGRLELAVVARLLYSSFQFQPAGIRPGMSRVVFCALSDATLGLPFHREAPPGRVLAR